MNGKRNLLLRSMMYVPAYNRRYIEKALETNADALILDLEDSVPPERRQEARENIVDFSKAGCFHKKMIFIRINPIDSLDFCEDMTNILCDGIDGLMPSKVRCADDIVFIDKLLAFFERKQGCEEGKLLLTPLIETVDAVESIYQIAHSSKRLVALAFGGEDFLDDLGSTYTYQTTAFQYPRAAMAAAARSAHLVPIDTPYLKISDLDGFSQAEAEAYKNGYGGCLVLNPKQIDAANTAFSPSAQEIEHARGVIDAIAQYGREDPSGVVMYNGAMVGPPMRKRAYRVMEQVRLLQEAAGQTEDSL